MTTVQASRSSFMIVLILFSIAVILMGVSDLRRRSLREPAPLPGAGRALVRDLYGQVDLRERSAERRVQRSVATEGRERDWGAVRRFLSTLIP